jgi:hydrogenase nickel incorporation protein HypA/HybF
MHELSLAGGILRIVEDVARREGFARVERLHLRVGAFSCVDVRALRFALDAISPETPLYGATLHIDEPRGRAFCFGCGEHVELDSRDSDCPTCGSRRLQPTAGDEIKVVELVVRD